MPEERYRRFTTTRWSLILAAADPRSSSAHEALSSLCEIYWMPVYAFVRRTGASVEDARDLTQAFFTTVLEKGYFKHAQRERGRFRTFLLTAVAHFLSNQRKADRALKRGGGQVVLSLDVDDGERRYQLEPVDTMTPERLFDRRWALAVLDHAMARLSAQYAGLRSSEGVYDVEIVSGWARAGVVFCGRGVAEPDRRIVPGDAAPFSEAIRGESA